MGVTTKKYVKKPLIVEAVRITRKNFGEIVKWCDGDIHTEPRDHRENPGKKFIKIQVHNPINARQTKAFVGDWILKTERGFKIYPHKAFTESFDDLSEQKTYPDELGPHIIIGPECFAEKDGSVLSWKGVNYVPQTDEDELDSCGVNRHQLDLSVPQ